MCRDHMALSGVAPRAGAWIETRVPLEVTTKLRVAPRAGAWIETWALQSIYLKTRSLPARERGLKQYPSLVSHHVSTVAPRAGAWIETKNPVGVPLRQMVAPRAGAWIETIEPEREKTATTFFERAREALIEQRESQKKHEMPGAT